MSTPSIVVVGSLNADFVVHVPRFPSPGETLRGERFAVLPGGKGANQACAAARLGASVAIAGQVGTDAHGAFLREAVRATGVETGCIAADEQAATGVALITIAADGENQIVLAPGANGTFGPERLAPVLPLIRQSRVVLLQLEIPMATVQRAATEARAAGATVVLDPAPASAVPEDLLALCEFLTPNETELAVLAGEPPPTSETPIEVIDRRARRLIARGCPQILVKLGDRGARLVLDDRAWHWPAFAVTAVDTTAAGDAFNGAFAVALAEQQPIQRALTFASAAAALSVTKAGAVPSMPSRIEVDQLVSGKHD
jgi:ribokinase